ncbi:MAG: hypothetical protein J7L12_05355 [Desulfurococcales archaeon]|nr:hypothetical protein [Desulfurococcales archaeon]
MVNRFPIIVGIVVGLLVSIMSYSIGSYYAIVPNQFSMRIVPGETLNAFEEQECVFLVSVEDEGGLLQGKRCCEEPVNIFVKANEDVAKVRFHP